MSYNNNSCFNHGNKIQEEAVEFLEDLGYDFIAGDRNGRTVNIDMIEEICRCYYVYPEDGVNGPMLNIQGRNYTMPDELVLLKGKNKFQWFEIKNRTMDNLYERYELLFHYLQVQKGTGIPVFILLVIYNHNRKQYDYYVLGIRKILENIPDNTFLDKKIKFNLNDFKRLN
jgi:hypothetical protein